MQFADWRFCGKGKFVPFMGGVGPRESGAPAAPPVAAPPPPVFPPDELAPLPPELDVPPVPEPLEPPLPVSLRMGAWQESRQAMAPAMTGKEKKVLWGASFI